MPKTKMVKLKNGAEVPEDMINTNMKLLRLMADIEKPVVLSELYKKCSDENYKISHQGIKGTLSSWALMVDGGVGPMIRNIVLSAVIEDETGIHLQDPVAESTNHTSKFFSSGSKENRSSEKDSQLTLKSPRTI